MWNLFTIPPILSTVVRVLFKLQRTLRESTHFAAATHLLSRPRSFGKSNCWTNDIPTLFAILILCHDWISNAYTSGMCYESTTNLDWYILTMHVAFMFVLDEGISARLTRRLVVHHYNL